jgi:hypothetical protein
VRLVINNIQRLYGLGRDAKVEDTVQRSEKEKMNKEDETTMTKPAYKGKRDCLDYSKAVHAV